MFFFYLILTRLTVFYFFNFSFDWTKTSINLIIMFVRMLLLWSWKLWLAQIRWNKNNAFAAGSLWLCSAWLNAQWTVCVHETYIHMHWYYLMIMMMMVPIVSVKQFTEKGCVLRLTERSKVDSSAEYPTFHFRKNKK